MASVQNTVTAATLFSLQYLKNLAVLAGGAFAVSFLGSLAGSTGIPNVHGLEIAAWSAASAAIAATLHAAGVSAHASSTSSPPSPPTA